MKINKICSKLIKPHTPTPQSLNKYKLSFLDKKMQATDTSVVLFYESKPEEEKELEESLAKILVDFYPLAGRYIKSEGLVDCSDEGAAFLKAEAADVDLLDLVRQTAEIEQEQLVPYFNTDEAAVDPLLSIQITHFPCGGVAMGISISHRVFDGASVGTFIAAWSSAHRDHKMAGGGGRIISPSFHLSSLLPSPTKEIKLSTSNWDHLLPWFEERRKKVVKRRVLFDKVALATLKSKVRPTSDGRSVSGVRVVSAVIAKALIGADRAKNGGRSRDFAITQLVNMRGRTVCHPQPKESCGNFVVGMLTRHVAASDIGIQELVDLIGDAVGKCISDYAEILSPGHDLFPNSAEEERFLKAMGNPDINFIVFNDWSRFGFYEADFGWGKPVFTAIPPQSHNTTVLMSDRDGGGIEAWVHLNQDHMPYFDLDAEIKTITTSYPSYY